MAKNGQKSSFFKNFTKKNQFFNFFQKFKKISLKNEKKLKKKFFWPKNGQKWPNFGFFSKKNPKNDICPNFAIFYLGKIFKLLFLVKKTPKKDPKLFKNQKNGVLTPKMAKNGQKWPKNPFFWKKSCFFKIWPFFTTEKFSNCCF